MFQEFTFFEIVTALVHLWVRAFRFILCTSPIIITILFACFLAIEFLNQKEDSIFSNSKAFAALGLFYLAMLGILPYIIISTPILWALRTLVFILEEGAESDYAGKEYVIDKARGLHAMPYGIPIWDGAYKFIKEWQGFDKLVIDLQNNDSFKFFLKTLQETLSAFFIFPKEERDVELWPGKFYHVGHVVRNKIIDIHNFFVPRIINWIARKLLVITKFVIKVTAVVVRKIIIIAKPILLNKWANRQRVVNVFSDMENFWTLGGSLVTFTFLIWSFLARILLLFLFISLF